jgi:hypothetical protein
MLNQAKTSLAVKPMNPRYVKELRLLLLPASVAALAALSFWLPFIRIGDSPPAAFVFPVCIALVAALSFGGEFQHRTLPLLLVQPLERSRLWWEKMAVLGGLVSCLGLLVWQVQGLANEFSGFHRAMFNLFLFAAVCSAGFWVQQTRSTAVGFLLAVASQVLLFTGASLLFRLCLGPEPYPWDAQERRLLVLVGIIYLGACLWLGWPFWKRRLWGLAGLGLAILVFHAATQFFLRQAYAVHPASQDMVLGGMFMLAAVCSSGFWTLGARSTIGGAVFNAAGQFLGVLILGLVLPNLHPALAIDGPYAAGTILVGGLVYSLVFLWLGWRTFSRLELSAAAVGEGVDLSQQVGWRWPRMGWLKCSPRGGLLNLVRKELVLQRPTFLVAAVLAGCWLVTFVIQWVAPERREFCHALASALAFISVPLTLLLAGSVSLGEEKSLGISAWHLTLPIRAWRQWWIKVGVSVVTGLFVGMLLPTLLIWATAGFEHSEPIRILHLDSAELVLIVLGAALVVVMSCWAVALFGTVVRATIGGLLALACLGGCAAISVWCAFGLGGLQTDLISSLTEGLRLAHANPTVDGVVVMTALMIAALWQGFLQFRRARVPGNLWVKYLAILILVVVVATAWLVDLSVSAEGLSDLSLRQEVEPATRRVVATKADIGPGKWQVIGLAFPEGPTQMFGFPLPSAEGK